MKRKNLDNLLRNYSPDDLRGGVLLWWLDNNQEQKQYLRPNSITNEFLEKAGIDKGPVSSDLSRILGTPNLKSIEAVFERVIESHRRKKQGAIYTPDHIIDYLLTQALTFSKSQKPNILDPACGSGGFLIRAINILMEKLKISFEDAIYNHIGGIDNDPTAVKHAKCLIEIMGASKLVSIFTNEIPIICEDSLLTSHSDLLELLKTKKGFSVVATNPPYVKLQTLDEEYRIGLSKNYSEFMQYNFSLAILFLIAGRRFLSEHGCLAYITQNNLFTSFAGEKVRQILQNDRCIRRIIDFGHHCVFKGILAYTCLIFLDQKRHNEIEFERVETDTTLEILNSLNFGKVSVNSLNHKKWRLAKSKHLSNISKIESIGMPLGSIADIRVGFATLKDKVFLLNGDVNKKFCSTIHPESGSQYEIEIEITRPALRVADIRGGYDLDAVTKRILFPYYHTPKGFILISERDLRTKYPFAYEYLLSCRKLLDSRDKGKRSYDAWYAWGRTQGREAKGPKLLTKTFNTKPEFYFDPTDRLFCNGYSVSVGNKNLFNPYLPLEILKIVLESGIMHYYSKLTSFQIDGNYQCYQKNFIEQFGIPEISEDIQAKLLNAEKDERDIILSGLYQITISELTEIIGEIPQYV